MILINDIDFYSIRKATLTFLDKKTLEKKKEALKNVMDEILLENLEEKEILSLYDKLNNLAENKIRQIIKEKTGQEPIIEGTKVKMLVDFSENLKKGDIVEIDECIRYEEDTFGQGWYGYTIKGYRIYPHEFKVI